MRKHLAVALAATCCGVLAAPAAANHSWNGYHWARTANPFGLSLGDNVGPAWDSYLGTASANWSKSTILDTTITVSADTVSHTVGAQLRHFSKYVLHSRYAVAY